MAVNERSIRSEGLSVRVWVADHRGESGWPWLALIEPGRVLSKKASGWWPQGVVPTDVDPTVLDGRMPGSRFHRTRPVAWP